MDILRDGVDRVPEGVRTAVTIGVYDGIHRGHQTILQGLRRRADDEGLAVAVVTFDVHPASILRPESAPKILTNREQRRELFAEHGVDYLYLVEFNADRAKTDQGTFGAEVLVEALRARVVMVGEDFHFGRNRSGNVETLRSLGEQHEFDVIGMELFTDPGATEHISSTAIRRKLVGGHVAEAAEMLGRLHEIRGEVIGGDERGRTIGFPTANVRLDDGAANPADGVYAAWCVLENGERHPAAVNIGKRPTFHEHAPASVLEAHLLDFDGDLYGQQIRVQFVRFLRSEARFAGIDALVAQLSTDIEAARAALVNES